MPEDPIFIFAAAWDGGYGVNHFTSRLSTTTSVLPSYG